MDEDQTTYPEYRHVLVARYGRFRIDKTWARWEPTDPTDGRWFSYEEVFEIDAFSEFDLKPSLLWTGLYKKVYAGEVLSPSELHRLVTSWLDRHRPTPGGGLVSTACYRRRIGPADEEHDATPGEWYTDHLIRRPGRPMIDMPEAASLVEAALRELEETGTAG
jgi:hypothetical protein